MYIHIILVNRDILSLQTHALITSGPITCTGWSPPSRRAIIYRGNPGYRVPRLRPSPAHITVHRHTALGSRTVAVATAAARLYILYTDGHSITSRICSTAVVRTTIEHFCYTRAHTFI